MRGSPWRGYLGPWGSQEPGIRSLESAPQSRGFFNLTPAWHMPLETTPDVKIPPRWKGRKDIRT